MLMQFMPLMFLFFFSHTPSGLVIYWVASNMFTVAQQYLIMRRYKVDNPIDGLIGRLNGGAGRWRRRPRRDLAVAAIVLPCECRGRGDHEVVEGATAHRPRQGRPPPSRAFEALCHPGPPHAQGRSSFDHD